ncbi:hypothetical protein FQA47_009183 [Oryzias melastigma]|uniref:Uncharacterized protein n=1 Tax=Oryzias melastigma TaxID=30732 RepID=A0A834FLJ1_ORYME|nr:hypothetical protein FQA47_009183 [Oryzias melastigma]
MVRLLTTTPPFSSFPPFPRSCTTVIQPELTFKSLLGSLRGLAAVVVLNVKREQQKEARLNCACLSRRLSCLQPSGLKLRSHPPQQQTFKQIGAFDIIDYKWKIFNLP